MPHARQFLPVWGALATSWANARAGVSPARAGKTQIVHLPLALAGHNLHRLGDQLGQDTAAAGCGTPLDSPSTSVFAIELTPTTSILRLRSGRACAARQAMRRQAPPT